MLGSLRCEAKAQFSGQQSAGPAAGVDVCRSRRVERGRTDDARLPFSLSDLRAHIDLNNDGFELTNLNCNGPATLEVCRCRGGYRRASPMYWRWWENGLRLDHNLVRVLPEPVRKQWYKVSVPRGRSTSSSAAGLRRGEMDAGAEINCLNVSFLCDKFPYRLDRSTGRLKFNDKRLTAELTAYPAAADPGRTPTSPIRARISPAGSRPGGTTSRSTRSCWPR